MFGIKKEVGVQPHIYFIIAYDKSKPVWNGTCV